MNNEPVGYVYSVAGESFKSAKSNQCSLDIADHLSRGEYDWCPEAETRLREQHDYIKFLEAHPAKTLTDEEIIEVHVNTPFTDGYLNKNLITFARAILRKAQEK